VRQHSDRPDTAFRCYRVAPELRLVCEWLQYDTVRRTARALRVSPMTIYQRLKRLRAALLAADLDHSCRKVETLGR
jgi:predicted RNA polymerase sigma factor